MFFRAIAEEAKLKGEKEFQRIRVLNYAPGPLETDMQIQIRNEMVNFNLLLLTEAGMRIKESLP